MATMTISRRQFARYIGTGVAFAAVDPTVILANPPDPWSKEPSAMPIVRLSSNENPYGPSPAAVKAMANSYGLAWRYPDEYADMLTEALAKLHRVSSDEILLGNGSGEILKLCAVTFTGKNRKAVVADPTFEAIGRHAAAAEAEVVKITLTSDYRHDLAKMLDSAGGAGLVYICNPNNPTATITPKQEVRAFLEKLPRGTTVLIDEAYHHYVESDDYESLIPMVKNYPNIIIARTFSKIYGMAGLRCGYCVSQPQNIQQMRKQHLWDNVNIMALVAAVASLDDEKHVDHGRQTNHETRQRVYLELDKLGYRYIPSHANFLMIDLRREVRPVLASLNKRNVQVGRFFPPLPNFMRVTIGTRPQMESFISAFREVMG